MKLATLTHTAAVALSSVSAFFSHARPVAAPSTVTPVSAASNLSAPASTPAFDFAFTNSAKAVKAVAKEKFPWKHNIVTTVFWIGEKPTANNPTPNKSSSWDKQWTVSYGGFDNPDPSARRGYVPAKFTPKQNPFYCALPYNDKAREGHRPEAPQVVPWFKDAYRGPAVSTCKDRWIAIRKGGKTVYAQWEDAGPFRTDHWQYVFGNERPKPNLNKGAGLDVSPAVRDYLEIGDTDVTDWRFVDFSEVPQGPWARYGDNNTFVIKQRRHAFEMMDGDGGAIASR